MREGGCESRVGRGKGKRSEGERGVEGGKIAIKKKISSNAGHFSVNNTDSRRKNVYYSRRHIKQIHGFIILNTCQ